MKKLIVLSLAFSSTACASIIGISDSTQPTTVASFSGETTAMFVVGKQVFYTSGEYKDLASAAADGSGSSPSTLNAENLDGLTSDGTTICGRSDQVPATIECADLSTGNFNSIAQFDTSTGANPLMSLQSYGMHGGNVFWVAQSIDNPETTITELIQYAPAQSGTSTPSVTTVYSQKITITASSADPSYPTLAADDSNVYFSDDSGSVYSIVWSGSPNTGQTPTKLATGGPTSTGIVAVDSTNVYLAGAAQSGDLIGTIYAVPIGGGSVSTLIGNLDIGGFVSDGAFVYLTDNKQGTISKIPVSGGSPIELASGQSSPGAVDVDSHFLYWVTTTDGFNSGTTIYRAPK